MVRTCGVAVGPGGSKYSSMASRRFSRASSSLSPWLATSTSKHCATYQIPSCHTLAENVLFIVLVLFDAAENLWAAVYHPERRLYSYWTASTMLLRAAERAGSRPAKMPMRRPERRAAAAGSFG